MGNPPPPIRENVNKKDKDPNKKEPSYPKKLTTW